MKLKKNIMDSAFIKSFKIDKTKIKIYFIDMSFLFVILIIALVFMQLFYSGLSDMDKYGDSIKRLSDVFSRSVEKNEGTNTDFITVTAALTNFFYRIFFITIFLLLILLFAAGFIKTITWTKLLGKKFDKKLFFKYSLLILSWNLFWVSSLFFIVFGLKLTLNVIQILVLILVLLYIYFSMIMSPVFFRLNGFRYTIRQTFKLGVFEFYRLLIPFIVVIVGLSITAFLVVMMFRIPIIWLSIILGVFIAWFYIVWQKFYMNEVIKELFE